MSSLPMIQPTDEGMLSHRGHVRPINEDSYGSFRTVLTSLHKQNEQTLLTRKGQLYVVADGMGGHDSGDVASATAVQQICSAYYRNPSDDLVNALQQAIEQANTSIYQTARTHRQSKKRTMGTTVVCAVIHQDKLIIAHVGDSRAYRLRDGTITQLTTDHNWMTDQMQTHGLSLEEAEQRAKACGAQGTLMRAVGVQASVEADIITTDWQDEDTLLLCSDGLHGLVNNEEISRILSNNTASLASRELIQAANIEGGHDNITALVVHKGHSTPPVHFSRYRPTAVVKLLSLFFAGMLLMLGFRLPIASGEPVLGSISVNNVREFAGLPTLPPTATLQPTETSVPTATAVPPTPTVPIEPTAVPPTEAVVVDAAPPESDQPATSSSSPREPTSEVIDMMPTILADTPIPVPPTAVPPTAVPPTPVPASPLPPTPVSPELAEPPEDQPSNPPSRDRDRDENPPAPQPTNPPAPQPTDPPAPQPTDPPAPQPTNPPAPQPTDPSAPQPTSPPDPEPTDPPAPQPTDPPAPQPTDPPAPDPTDPPSEPEPPKLPPVKATPRPNP
ncbi:MAG: protein phosphatase 2C domain-containing protein [Chloroflexota bacterium]